MAKIAVLSPALVVVLLASVLAAVFAAVPSLALDAAHYVEVPLGGFSALAAAVPAGKVTEMAARAAMNRVGVLMGFGVREVSAGRTRGR